MCALLLRVSCLQGLEKHEKAAELLVSVKLDEFKCVCCLVVADSTHTPSPSLPPDSREFGDRFESPQSRLEIIVLGAELSIDADNHHWASALVKRAHPYISGSSIAGSSFASDVFAL